MSRKDRSEEQKKEALDKQLGLLLDYCELFDQGRLNLALPMAGVLRVLVHDKPARGRGRGQLSLLTQLGLRDGPWCDTSFRLAEFRSAKEFTCLLVGMAGMPDGRMGMVPNCQLPRQMQQGRQASFDQWWTDHPISASQAHGSKSRSDVVLAIAEMDAVHSDESLPEWYSALKDGSFLRIQGSVGGGTPQPLAHMDVATVRQIAHETLLTMRSRGEATLPRSYSFPYSGGVALVESTRNLEAPVSALKSSGSI